MNRYYLSLCRGLTGCYVEFQAESEEVVRKHAARYFGLLWCSVYTDAYFLNIIRKRFPSQSRVINRNNPIILSDEEGMWE